jgi:ammonia channel protein AmtB
MGMTLMEFGRNPPAHKRFSVLKTGMMLGLGFFAYWLIGYGLSNGNLKDDEFAGDEKFAGDDWTDGERALDDWFYCLIYGVGGLSSLLFIQGSFIGRMDFHVYLFLCLVYMTVVYPIVVAWSWGNGWLTKVEALDDHEFHD